MVEYTVNINRPRSDAIADTTNLTNGIKEESLDLPHSKLEPGQH